MNTISNRNISDVFGMGSPQSKQNILNRNTNIISFLDMLQSGGLNNLKPKFEISKKNNAGFNTINENNKDSAVSNINKLMQKNGDDINISSEFKKAVSEILKKDDKDEVKVDLLKLMELLGVSQNILYDFALSANFGNLNALTESEGNFDGISNIENLQSAEFTQVNMFLDSFNRLNNADDINYIDYIDEIGETGELNSDALNDFINKMTEETKQFVSEFYSEVQAEYKKSIESAVSGISNNLNNDDDDGNAGGSGNAAGLNGLDGLKDSDVYKNALVNYVSGKIGDENTAGKEILNNALSVVSDAAGENEKFEILSLIQRRAVGGQTEQIQDKPAIIDMFNAMKKIPVSESGTNAVLMNPAELSDLYEVSKLSDLSKNLNELAKNIMNGENNSINLSSLNNMNKSQGNPGDISVQILSGVTDARSMAVNNPNAVLTDMSANILNISNISDAGIKISDLIVENINNAQIAQNMRDGIQNNFEIKLKLFPEELGELFVKVAYSKGNVSVNIIAENPLAEREILNQMENLRASLLSHEFNLSGFDVSSRNNFNYGQNGNGQNGNYYENQNSDGRYNRYINISGDSFTENSPADINKSREIVMNYLRSKRLVYKTV